MVKAVFTEPLVQFFMLGAALFGLEAWVIKSSNAVNDQVIRVDEAAVVNFIGDQTNTTQANALKKWQQLDDAAQRWVVDHFVREEALYRKALSFGLNENDYVIRRRLVQKMEFAGKTFDDDLALPSDEAIQAYYAGHPALFLEPPTVTFTHVFFRHESLGSDGEMERAVAALGQLREEGVAFDQSGRFGERFAYHRNYIDQSQPLIADHFGVEFARQVFLMDEANGWQGPVLSERGVHLVLIANRSDARLPALVEVRQRIVSELMQQRIKTRTTAFEDRILAEFTIESDFDRLEHP